ncbi:MAG: chemotaxis protein CheC, partial [SAR202 cluster bacterium]|nr:chemotaxis protein CheC [SAR202 cluster bacterium]
QAHVTLHVPEVRVITPSEIDENMDELGWDNIAGVKMTFDGLFYGTAAIVFPAPSAAALADVLTEEESDDSDLDSVRVSVLTEVGNIIINGVMGTIGNFLHEPLQYAIPSFAEGDIQVVLGADQINQDAAILMARARFTVEAYMILGDILLVLEGQSLGTLLDSITESWESDVV